MHEIWVIHGCQAAQCHAITSGKVAIASVIRSSPLAGLCYDTPSVEVGLFLIDTPDKTPYTLSEDFYQEKLPSKPLVERFRRKNRLSIGMVAPH